MESPIVMFLHDGNYKAVLTRIANVDAVLKSVADAAPERLSGVFTVNGQPGLLSIKHNQIIAGVRLREIKLTTYFALDGSLLVPKYACHADHIQATCAWTVPGAMQVYLGAVVRAGTNNWKATDYVLFATINGTPGYFRLPLSNMHSDGRICMGSGYAPIKPCIQEVMQASVDHLDSAQWNTDLSPDAAKSARLFRFDPATLKSVPPPADLADCCTRVNNTLMEDLVNGQ
jgi:hypothetical protein